MDIYIKRPKKNIQAVGYFNDGDGTVVVKKGSVVSSEISHSEKFRGSKSIEAQREKYVVDCIVKEDVCFKSSSTAANFVTGFSTNGLRAWKTDDGKSLKEYLCAREAGGEC